MSRRGKVAFTLAEVLITLGIIGIVSALTIPSLMTKINDKVTSTKKEVMERKLVQSLNMLNNKENGLNVSYDTTEDFVKALSKYLKVIQICSKDNLTDCFPYNKINYENNAGSKTINVSSLTTAVKLKLIKGNWLEPAGFIMADGTPFIISYNNDCGTLTNDKGQTIVDPDRPIKDIPYQCIDGIYDNNGTRSPNKFGKDIQPIFGANLGCLLEVNNKCLISTPAVVPTPIKPSTYCTNNNGTYTVKSEYSALGISNCCTSDNCKDNGDYWVGAMKMCKDLGMRLPTDAELTQLASYLYNTDVASEGETNGTLDTTKIPESLSDLGSYYFFLWSSAEYSSGFAYRRYFYLTVTSRSNPNRDNSHLMAFCVADE